MNQKINNININVADRMKDFFTLMDIDFGFAVDMPNPLKINDTCFLNFKIKKFIKNENTENLKCCEATLSMPIESFYNRFGTDYRRAIETLTFKLITDFYKDIIFNKNILGEIAK
jgi:hypothetical protein